MRLWVECFRKYLEKERFRGNVSRGTFCDEGEGPGGVEEGDGDGEEGEGRTIPPGFPLDFLELLSLEGCLVEDGRSPGTKEGKADLCHVGGGSDGPGDGPVEILPVPFSFREKLAPLVKDFNVGEFEPSHHFPAEGNLLP